MISVIVPVYNTPSELIDRSITSVLNQRVDVELLLVDDGSEESTARYLDDLSSASIRVFHKPNGGVSSARNYGLAHCEGDYITFVDPDDEVTPGYLSEALKIATRYDADVVFGGMEYVYPDGKVNSCPQSAVKAEDAFVVEDDDISLVERSLFEKGALEEIGLVPIQYVSNCASLYRSSVVDGVRFDEGIVISEDRIFNFEVLEKSARVALAGGVWYRYFQNSNSASHKVRLNAADELVATSRKYIQLCQTYDVDNRVRSSVAIGILECFYQAVIFCVFDPEFRLHFGRSRCSYIKSLLRLSEFSGAFNSAKPKDIRWIILLIICRLEWAGGVLAYAKTIRFLQSIKKTITYRKVGDGV